MTRVEWTHTAETSRLLRALALAAFGAIAGLFGFLATFSLFVLAGSLLAGEFAVLALLLAFALLGGRRLATHAALARADSGSWDAFSARDLLAASVAWAGSLAGLLAAGAPVNLLFAVVIVAVFACLPVAAALRSEGYVDTKAGLFEVNNREASLSAVERVRRYDLGPVALLWVHYHDGAGGASAPRFFGLPAHQADSIETAIESSDAEPPERDRNPAIAWTLYAFAVGAFLLAAAFAYFAAGESGDAAAVGGYVALFAAFFGALFAWLGSVEG